MVKELEERLLGSFGNALPSIRYAEAERVGVNQADLEGDGAQAGRMFAGVSDEVYEDLSDTLVVGGYEGVVELRVQVEFQGNFSAIAFLGVNLVDELYYVVD